VTWESGEPEGPVAVPEGIEAVGAAEGPEGLGAEPAAASTGPVGATTEPLGIELPRISPGQFKTLARDLPANFWSNQMPASGRLGNQGSKVVNEAMRYIGTPYRWGGTNPSGFDCSGFVQYVYAQMGINLPRISYQQAQAGRRISLRELRPGDLVAWDNSSRNPGADHIAIYIGGGKVIEAPYPGAKVRIRRLDDPKGAWGVRIGAD
jgi:hypothetical protein